MQTFPHPGEAGATQQESSPTDERVGKDMHALMSEAAERVTFHRIELERWSRLGHAASAALHHLQMAEPVPQCSPEDFAATQPDQSDYDR